MCDAFLALLPTTRPGYIQSSIALDCYAHGNAGRVPLVSKEYQGDKQAI